MGGHGNSYMAKMRNQRLSRSLIVSSEVIMILELTPKTYFEYVNREGPLHVVMNYGSTCGPCKMTMPNYESVSSHFLTHNITNVKFYRFHQWEPEYREFIETNGMHTYGVPTFRYYYFGELISQATRSYNDANELKKNIIDIIKLLENNIGEFKLHES